MNALTFVLLLNSTATTQVPATSQPAVKTAEVKKEDCDESSALMKKLGTEAKPDEKAQKDAAVNGLANIGVIPAEKVEEKKVAPTIAAPKMENCQ